MVKAYILMYKSLHTRVQKLTYSFISSASPKQGKSFEVSSGHSTHTQPPPPPPNEKGKKRKKKKVCETPMPLQQPFS